VNAKLRNLLIGGGVVVAVAGVATLPFIPKLSTSRLELIDGGIKEDCNFRRLACTAFINGGYQEREFTVAVCPTGDGGAPESIYPRKAADIRAHLIDEDLHCRRIGTPSDVDLNEDPPVRPGSCACHSPPLGNCADDAGMIASRNQARPGTWSGPGCVPMPCGQLLGRDVWPNECPR